MDKTALYLSTFQPVHQGHVEDIKHIYSLGIKDILLGVGSSKQHHLFKDPFTSAERQEMLNIMIEHDLKDILQTRPSIHNIPDTWDIDETYEYIRHNLPAFDVIVTRNKKVEEMCNKYGIPTIRTPRSSHIWGQDIRHQITLDNQEELKRKLSPEILQYIHHLDATSRLKDIAVEERVQPKLAVDIVEMDDEGYVSMIERGFAPV